MFSIAIIGSGPSALYTADALSKKNPDICIDIYEKDEKPFGLVRYGIAPDHQSTRNVYHQFNKILARDNVNLFLNTEISFNDTRAKTKVIDISCLKKNYSAVVLATGAFRDRNLGIIGEHLPQVINSAEVVKCYNQHPQAISWPFKASTQVVTVIGNGNVALDIARILSKSERELKGTGIKTALLSEMSHAALKRINIIGRRGPLESSFSANELKELLSLEQATPFISEQSASEMTAILQDPKHCLDKKTIAKLNVLKQFKTKVNHNIDKVQICFQFWQQPLMVHEGDSVKSLVLESTKFGDPDYGKKQELASEYVIKAIGYNTTQLSYFDYDTDTALIKNQHGWIEDNIYAVGWCRRGAQGGIVDNRKEAFDIAALIKSDINCKKIIPKSQQTVL